MAEILPTSERVIRVGPDMDQDTKNGHLPTNPRPVPQPGKPGKSFSGEASLAERGASSGLLTDMRPGSEVTLPKRKAGVRPAGPSVKTAPRGRIR